jgi:RNA polymerase sigma factor (sigma-70 family)
MNGMPAMEKAVFEGIYDRYVDLVCYTACRIVRDYHLAQDVCQEVFEKLYFLKEKPEMQRIKGWLLITTRNTAVDFLRKRKRYRENGESTVEAAGAAGQTLEERQRQTEQREFFCRVLGVLREKNPVWYEIMVDMEVEGHPAGQTARKLGITESNLRVCRCRARKWLREEFELELCELL